MKLGLNVVTVLSALFLAAEVHATGAAEALHSKGAFHGGSHAPADTVSGGVVLIRLESGEHELRLGDDFKSTAGPDLFVYLSAAEDPRDDAEVANNVFFDARKLNSPAGGQSYALPKGFDPAKFRAVAI